MIPMKVTTRRLYKYEDKVNYKRVEVDISFTDGKLKRVIFNDDLLNAEEKWKLHYEIGKELDTLKKLEIANQFTNLNDGSTTFKI